MSARLITSRSVVENQRTYRLLLGRMTRHIYRPIGRGPGGPLALDPNAEHNLSEAQVIEMDQALRWIEGALDKAVSQQQKSRAQRKNGTPAPYTPLVTAQFSVQGVCSAYSSDLESADQGCRSLLSFISSDVCRTTTQRLLRHNIACSALSSLLCELST